MVWKAVGNSSLPIAPFNQVWDADEARERIFCWAGWYNKIPSNRTWKAFFVYDKDRPNLRSAYLLPFTDVINGELMAVPCAIDAIARELAAHENELGLPKEVLEDVRRKIDLYYRKMNALQRDIDVYTRT